MGRGPSSRRARNHKCTVTKGGRARKLKGRIKNLEKVRAAARVQTPAEGHEPETTVPHTFANTATMSLLTNTTNVVAPGSVTATAILAAATMATQHTISTILKVMIRLYQAQVRDRHLKSGGYHPPKPTRCPGRQAKLLTA